MGSSWRSCLSRCWASGTSWCRPGGAVHAGFVLGEAFQGGWDFGRNGSTQTRITTCGPLHSVACGTWRQGNVCDLRPVYLFRSRRLFARRAACCRTTTNEPWKCRATTIGSETIASCEPRRCSTIDDRKVCICLYSFRRSTIKRCAYVYTVFLYDCFRSELSVLRCGERCKPIEGVHSRVGGLEAVG